ncbi:hypothetical protein CBR_g3146 [Chara braunii]|uniref:arginine--tRNA ligase n=1 Tax=Chara braunii TaxID=69332 RepID=A0A388KF79_CHABU|nr:hypothetical protein CBR_g3146 [Chara braunii]|eukprot:GBG68603.1 hypothetical protein CBR_g3146 [Chara braunii]
MMPPFPSASRPFSLSLFRPSCSLLCRAAVGQFHRTFHSSPAGAARGRTPSWLPEAAGVEGTAQVVPRGGSSLHPRPCSSRQHERFVAFQNGLRKQEATGNCRGGGGSSTIYCLLPSSSSCRQPTIGSGNGLSSASDRGCAGSSAVASSEIGGGGCSAFCGREDASGGHVRGGLPSGFLRCRGGNLRGSWKRSPSCSSAHGGSCYTHASGQSDTGLLRTSTGGVGIKGPDRLRLSNGVSGQRGILACSVQLGREGIGMAEAGADAAAVLPPGGGDGDSAASAQQIKAVEFVKDGSVRQLLSELVAESLKTTFPDLAKNVAPVVVPCNNAAFGDYQCNNAMALFAQVKGKNSNFKNPRAVGEAIMKNLPETPLIETTSIAGPGFINIKLSKSWLEQRLEMILQDGLNSWAPVLPVKRVVVDFSSPNIAKEMHVGHLRSTIIGDCISRMYEFCKVEVLRRNHVGDWGTQFGMLIQSLFEQNPDWMNQGDQAIGDLQNFYKAAKVRFDQDPEFKERAQQAVVRLQGGDEQSRLAWKRICEISRKEFQEIYDKLHVQIEEKGESFYNPLIPSVLDQLNEKGLTEMSEGALCIFVPGHNVPLIVRKSDGGFNYASTDLAALWYRMKTEKAEHVIYVTDVGQSSHFAMVFKAAEMAGWLEEVQDDGDVEGRDEDGASGYAAVAANNGKLEGKKEKSKVQLRHVGFGLVLGSDGKRFRTRSTEVVRLADLLDEAKNRSQVEIRQRLEERGDLKNWTEEEMEHAAKAVGYGAVKYADLKVNRLTNYTFSFEQMLDTRGNTAVYLLYAHARICSIIRKSGKDVEELVSEAGVLRLEHPMERQLALCLVRFSDVVESAINDLLPNQVCEYLYDLSCKFTDFYSTCNVIGSPEERSRLLICEVTARVMRMCFQLLGITPLYRL